MIPSLHRFLANDRNAIASAASLVASSVLAATDTAFPQASTRSGSARAVLSGGYTGQADADLELEIVAATGTGILSEAVFVGAGNGTLTGLTAGALPGQDFTVLLASTGTATKAAAASFYGVRLEAAASGAAGNGVTLETDTSGITATQTVYSFLEAVTAGTSEFTGPQWDFGCYALDADGNLDSRTPRLRFGHDPQVYRQYKELVDGDWKYIVDPPIVRDLPAETLVYTLGGTYTLTVTSADSPATVETYSALITLFDGLNALRTRSNLIAVDGVVVEDRTPGGMAMEEWPLRTGAYALPATYSGDEAFAGLGAVTVPAAAPTEIVTLTCASITTLGGEIWEVAGTVTGALPDCTAGVPYSASGYGWTVPQIFPDENDPDALPKGKIYVKDIVFASRPQGDTAEEQGIELCINPLVAGARAKAKTVEVIYTAKPPTDCLCEDAVVTGNLSEKCLGVELDEEAGMAITAAYRSRLIDLESWYRAFIASNVEITAEGELRSAELDMKLAKLAHDELADCLKDLYATGELTNSPDPETAWDDLLVELDADLTALEGIGSDQDYPPIYRAGMKVRLGAILRPPIENGYYYQLQSIGGRYLDRDVISGVPYSFQVPISLSEAILGEPDRPFPTALSSPIDEAAFPGTTDYQHSISRPTVDGEGNISWTMTNVPVTDVYLVFEPIAASVASEDINILKSATPEYNRDPAKFAEKYLAACNYVRALAGILPKGEASGEGSDCWQPCDGAYEWRLNGSEYLPACTNVPYHSCILQTDAQGNETIVSTQEFGFVIRCACPERLVEGDKFTIVIENDAAEAKTYQLGDTIKIPVVTAQPLELAGGVDGDDTLTWTVRGSLGDAWPDYVAPIGSEPVYDDGNSPSLLSFTIAQGGIPFELGDYFTFSAAGGTFKWRWNSGSWNGPTPLTDGAISLSDGLSVTFVPGPAPAFVAGDDWAFEVLQPHAPDRLQLPNRKAWRWDGTGGTLTVTFDSASPPAALETISAVAIWHDCPAGATFTLEGLDAADGVLWTEAVPYRAGLTAAILEDESPVTECVKLRLTVADATGGGIKWLWAGDPWTPEHPCSDIKLSYVWQLARGVDAARYLGKGAAGEIAWEIADHSWIESTDWAELLALLDYLKANGDQPFVFVANRDFPDEARLVRVQSDDVAFDDRFAFQYTPRRVMDVRLPLTAVRL